MSKRFINCSACKGCHTGRGGKYCPFLSPVNLTKQAAGVTMSDPDPVPDRDSDAYLPYLSEKIAEEEQRLKSLQDKCRLSKMEQ